MKLYFDYLSKLNENKKPAKKSMNESYSEYPTVSIERLTGYNDKVDTLPKEMIDSYLQLCTTRNQVERFNFHSDYWGDANSYQEEALDMFDYIDSYIGKIVNIEYDDGTYPAKILGLVIDKQYNNHLSIGIEELDDGLTESKKRMNE